MEMTNSSETGNHCKDCCCARSWKALGIADYTGKSIAECIDELKVRAELAAHKAVEQPMNAAIAINLHIEKCQKLEAELSTLQSEHEENCRLLGMSGERELALRTEISAYRAAVRDMADALYEAKENIELTYYFYQPVGRDKDDLSSTPGCLATIDGTLAKHAALIEKE